MHTIIAYIFLCQPSRVYCLILMYKIMRIKRSWMAAPILYLILFYCDLFVRISIPVILINIRVMLSCQLRCIVSPSAINTVLSYLAY